MIDQYCLYLFKFPPIPGAGICIRVVTTTWCGEYFTGWWQRLYGYQALHHSVAGDLQEEGVLQVIGLIFINHVLHIVQDIFLQMMFINIYTLNGLTNN